MQLYDNLASFQLERNTVLTIGAFDGVHLGHQHLVGQMISRAKQTDCLSALLTFHPHPNAILMPDNPPKYLTTPGQKAMLLERLGLDILIILPFDLRLANTPARDFIARINGPLRIRELWIGQGFALGRGREGDVATLSLIGQQLGFEVRVVPPFTLDGQVVSSTRIRQLLAEGRVGEAARLLNRYHSLSGEVVHGAGRGRRYGIPTANLQVRANRAVPANGIYAVWAVVGDERRKGVVNIGYRPSFDNGERTIEVHILDFNENIYGCDLLVEFVQWLRPEQRFDSVNALYAQIERDIQQTRAVLDSQNVYPQPLRADQCSPGRVSSGRPRFEELSYTADTGILCYGQDLRELFENAAYGMFALMGDIDGLFDTTRHHVEIDAPDREALLVDWLSELLYLHDTTGEVFVRFDIQTITETHVEADVYGTFLAQPRLEIKAVTYHDLSIQETEDGLKATVVFDI